MNVTKNAKLFPELSDTVQKLSEQGISTDRKTELQPLIDYIREKLEQDQPVRLNFICTHNSRRSQLSQIWAQTAAALHGVPVACYSGGVEVTAFNERAVAALERQGFRIQGEDGDNPRYQVAYAAQNVPIPAFSKLFDHPENASEAFAAVMTCSEADQNCPFIPGAEKRIPLRYDDPKEFDGTGQEKAKYDERSAQIASELLYVFAHVKPS